MRLIIAVILLTGIIKGYTIGKVRENKFLNQPALQMRGMIDYCHTHCWLQFKSSKWRYEECKKDCFQHN